MKKKLFLISLFFVCSIRFFAQSYADFVSITVNEHNVVITKLDADIPILCEHKINDRVMSTQEIFDDGLVIEMSDDPGQNVFNFYRYDPDPKSEIHIHIDPIGYATVDDVDMWLLNSGQSTYNWINSQCNVNDNCVGYNVNGTWVAKLCFCRFVSNVNNIYSANVQGLIIPTGFTLGAQWYQFFQEYLYRTLGTHMIQYCQSRHRLSGDLQDQTSLEELKDDGDVLSCNIFDLNGREIANTLYDLKSLTSGCYIIKIKRVNDVLSYKYFVE